MFTTVNGVGSFIVMKVQNINFHKILFYASIVIASIALMVFFLNVFYYETHVSESINVGLLVAYVSLMILSISQYLEMRNKESTSL